MAIPSDLSPTSPLPSVFPERPTLLSRTKAAVRHVWIAMGQLWVSRTPLRKVSLEESSARLEMRALNKRVTESSRQALEAQELFRGMPNTTPRFVIYEAADDRTRTTTQLVEAKALGLLNREAPVRGIAPSLRERLASAFQRAKRNAWALGQTILQAGHFVVDATRTGTAQTMQSLFTAGVGGVIRRYPSLVGRYLEWTAEAPAGSTSAGDKLVRIWHCLQRKKPHQAVFALSQPLGVPLSTGVISEKELLTAHTEAREAIHAAEKALKPLLPPPAAQLLQPPLPKRPVMTNHVRDSDKILCQDLTPKLHQLSAIALLDAFVFNRRLTFTSLKEKIAGENPIQRYFASLPFFPRLWARIVYLFLNPCLKVVFAWKSQEHPGLLPQLVAILRERLTNPLFKESTISTLLCDIVRLCDKRSKGELSELPPINTNIANDELVSWLQDRFVISSGWPLIGGFIDGLIKRKIVDFVRQQNLPKMVLDMYEGTSQVHPITVEIVEWLKDLTSETQKDLKRASDQKKKEIEAGLYDEAVDLPAKDVLPPLLDENKEPIEFHHVTRTITRYLAVQGIKGAELEEYIKRSRFNIHLHELQKKEADKASLLQAYVKELNEFLAAVKADKKLAFGHEITAAPIESQIEETIDLTLTEVVKEGLTHIFKFLEEEKTTEAILNKAVSFATRLITMPEASPEEQIKQKAAFVRSSEDLQQNIIQIISDSLDFKFDPLVQKEELEKPNRYALQLLSHLKEEVGERVETIASLIKKTGGFSSSKEALKFRENCQLAAKQATLLLDSCAKRLHQIYKDAPKGAFTEREIMQHMSQIRNIAKATSALAVPLTELLNTKLPALEKALHRKEVLERAYRHCDESPHPIATWFTLFQTEMAQAGIAQDKSTSFETRASSIAVLEKEKTTAANQTELIRQAIEAADHLQHKRASEAADTHAALVHARWTLQQVIKEGLLPAPELRDLDNPTGLARLLSTLAEKFAQASAREREKERLLHTMTATFKESLESWLSEEHAPLDHNMGAIHHSQNNIAEALSHLSAQAVPLNKAPLEAIEALPDVNHTRLQPLVDSYLAFLGAGIKTFIASPFNLQLITIAQLQRLRKSS